MIKKMRTRAEKRGELATGTLVRIILLVIGFGLVLFFLWQINGKFIINRQTCHESVIFRATLPSVAGVNEYVPLKCMSEKICVTSKIFGGECEEFKNTKGGVRTIRVGDLDDVEKVISEGVVDCWTMMGEGKLSIFSQWIAETYGIGSVYPSCVICSRIGFDRAALKKSGIDLSKMDVQRYMMTHKIPNGNKSYYDFLAGDNGKYSIDISAGLPALDIGKDNGKDTLTGQVDENGQQIKVDVSSMISQVGEQEKLEQKNDENMQTHELGILFMQISAPTQFGSLSNVGTTLAGGTAAGFALAPTIMAKGVFNLGKACFGSLPGAAICGSIGAVLAIFQQGSVAWNRAITAGYCGDVDVGTEARNGCSVVRTMNYNVSNIGEYCSVVESLA